MAEELPTGSAEETNAARTEQLAHALKSKQAQGYTIESQTDTTAVLVMKGRKRLFRPSADNRQLATVDEFGNTTFQKIESGDSGK